MEFASYSKSELGMLNRAHAVALTSEASQRVGAVVARKGKILAVACNRNRNHPTILEEDKIRAHAAICAERRALKMLTKQQAKGAVVYVVRAARRDDSFASSKPCERCEAAMEEAGIKRAVYVA